MIKKINYSILISYHGYSSDLLQIRYYHNRLYVGTSLIRYIRKEFNSDTDIHEFSSIRVNR